MTETNTPIEILIEKVENYGTTTMKVLQLKLIRTTSETFAMVLSQIIIYLAIGVFFLFCSIGLAFWLGELFGKIYYGFLAVGSFYGLIGLMIYLFQNTWFKIPFQNIFIDKLNGK
jgi:phosphoglycerol transferase MdoB-like AlkP superfamily enzyme